MEEILATIMACKQVRQNELTNAINLLKHKYFKRFRDKLNNPTTSLKLHSFFISLQ